MITCMRTINEECVRKLNGEITKSDIQYIMRTWESELPSEYTEIVVNGLKKFADTVYQVIREHKYNLQLTPITFVGGGATVMRLFGNNLGDNIRYIEDVRANAKGYEFLAKVALMNDSRKR